MKQSNKKIAYRVIGILLIAGLINGGNLKHITDWSTDIIAGANTFSIIAIAGSIYLLYLGFKK